MIDLDRRVEVLDGAVERKATVHRVSDLRSSSFVVLLGEPGIGKSTTFAAEAAVEGASVLKVRELMTGSMPSNSATLFLDALDEYRIDGQAADKAHHLGNAIAAVGASRWRLSCRSEDWRKAADIAPIRRTTDGAPIVVAQLLPLSSEEARLVLIAIGEQDPDGFLQKAEDLGATPFTESPLSLKLLQKAVVDGAAWPSTRFNLFAAAVRRLAHEHNDEHKFRERHSADEILEAASKASLMLLVSGARAIWRSNGEPPEEKQDRRAYLTASNLNLDRRLLEDMLDTPLFRGEGESFEPLHRSVAEYLAAKALAQMVVGSKSTAAFPLSRASALIRGIDGRPPSELRGLFAWFAAQLAKLGNAEDARVLIEADPVTVLTYGDAASFDAQSRRLILNTLGRDDPYYRSSEIGVTSVGGLAGEDLADDFRAALSNPSDGTHNLMTVYEVLKSGPPVHSLRPLLREIALDPKKPEWQRWRAADAWLNGAGDVGIARRELMSALATEKISLGREALRARLATALPVGALTLADIKSILSDFEQCPDDETIMRLYGFRVRLQNEPQPALFEEPVKLWRSQESDRRRRIETDDVLDHALAAAIRFSPNLSAKTLREWLANARDDVWDNIGDEAAKAVREWLKATPEREVELFDLLLVDDEPTNKPWMVEHDYSAIAHARPSARILDHLVARANETRGMAAKRYLEIAVRIARHGSTDPDVFWRVYSALADRRNVARLIKLLTVSPIESWRRRQYAHARRKRRQDATHKRNNVKTLSPMLDEMRVGKRPGHLSWAAQLYFRDGAKQPRGLDRVMYFTDEETTRAMEEGWRFLATSGLGDIDASTLGKADAEGRSYNVELAAIAGVDRLLSDGAAIPKSAALPIVAVAVAKSSWMVSNADQRARLNKWAATTLETYGARGRKHIRTFWEAALDAGAQRLPALYSLTDNNEAKGEVAKALEELLRGRPAMPIEALRMAIDAAAKSIGKTSMLALSERALASNEAIGAQRVLWSFIAFALDPLKHGERFVSEHQPDEVADLFGGRLDGGLLSVIGAIDPSARHQRELLTVRMLGRVTKPNDAFPNGIERTRHKAAYAVRGTIKSLASEMDAGAEDVLMNLLEDGTLNAWHGEVRHALAENRRVVRDRAYVHPEPERVLDALGGGAPLNAADLFAVVREELEKLRREMRSGDNTSWKTFWNLNSDGNVVEPLIENQCRNRLLDRLQDRLKSYRITEVMAEARRKEETRSDVLVLSGAGRNLPIEVKRHYHKDVWIAPTEQLQGYANTDGADGFGVYLIFWFGTGIKKPPARRDRVAPKSAVAMEQLLVADLPVALRERTSILVFDVSPPNPSSAMARGSGKRTGKRQPKKAARK